MNRLRASQPGATESNPPAEMARHWRVVVAALSGMMAINIYLYSFGLFIGPLQHEFGWSRSSITLVMLIWVALAIVVYPLIGILVDRYGPRRIAIPGLIAHGLFLGGLALCWPNLWSWWIGFALVVLSQISCGISVWTAGITYCFDARRGLALGIALAGMGISAAVVPSITNLLIESLGWRLAYVSLGALCWLIALPLVWLWFKPPLGPPRPKEVRHVGTTRAPISVVLFLQLAVATFLLAAALFAMVVHFVPLSESLGISRTTGAAIAGLIGIASIFGRVISGYLLDIYRLQVVGASLCALPILAAGLIVLAPTSIVAFSLAALLLGASVGAETDVVTYAVGRYFLRNNNYGVLLGVFSAILASGGAVGPVLASAIFDRTGDYRLLCLAVPVMCACGALLILTLRSPPAPSNTTWQLGES